MKFVSTLESNHPHDYMIAMMKSCRPLNLFGLLAPAMNSLEPGPTSAVYGRRLHPAKSSFESCTACEDNICQSMRAGPVWSGALHFALPLLARAHATVHICGCMSSLRMHMHQKNRWHGFREN